MITYIILKVKYTRCYELENAKYKNLFFLKKKHSPITSDIFNYEGSIHGYLNVNN